MGWMFLYECDTKKSLIEYLRKPYTTTTEDGEERTCGIIKDSLRGNNLWALYQTGAGRKMIALFLLAYDRRDKCWGYKDISEEMGPVQMDCPLSLLDAADEPYNEFAKEWRASVRELAAGAGAKKKARAEVLAQLAPGVTVRLKKGCTPQTIVVARVEKMSVFGQGFRVPKKYIAEVLNA